VSAGVHQDSDLTIARQQVRQYVYAYAAVAPAFGQDELFDLPFANTAMMNLAFVSVARFC